MAETLLSPGVLARENDQTVTSNIPAAIGAAIMGPTVKGQPYIPKLITSFTEYLTYFGGAFISGSSRYTFLTSTAAYNYFQNGGTSLWVTRIASGAFSPASSSTIASSYNATSASFVLSTLSYGFNQNSSGSEGVSGSLPNGTADNVRWQITNANTASGTFTLLIRRGNDTAPVPTVLETWPNLSLDPTQDNYIEKVIGNQTFSTSSDNLYINTTGNYPNRSNYVTVTSVPLKTPNYFNNVGTPSSASNGTPYGQYLPLNASGAFIGGVGEISGSTAASNYYNNISNTNIQGFTAANYSTAITLMSNADEYAYNVIAAPGLTYGNANGKVQLVSLINNTQNRGDAIAVIDTELYGGTVASSTNTANTVDTSYAATYWPWIQTVDPITGEFTWVPASTMIPSVYVQNDTIAAPWFAPAGLNRGGILNAVRAEKKLTQADRNTLYQNKVNPIATFPGTGVVVYGQKTLQTKSSALDRVNVRRLLIALKTRISEIANNLVFEQNTIATRQNFVAAVNPYLQSVQQQQGLYAFKVIMDDSNNSADVIDRNEMYGQIYLQPTKTAEFIYLDFNITPTGASFPA